MASAEAPPPPNFDLVGGGAGREKEEEGRLWVHCSPRLQGGGEGKGDGGNNQRRKGSFGLCVYFDPVPQGMLSSASCHDGAADTLAPV